MEVRMEITQGLGRRAEVWLDDEHLLTVCDGVSESGRRCAPGLLSGVHLGYMTVEGFSWDVAVKGNLSRKKKLEPDRGWSYVGYGQVKQVMPVVIDFGLLTMSDANWTTDESLVGRFVRIEIDRLELLPANEPDWPEGLD